MELLTSELLERLKTMARIHLNCPGSKPQGSSVYTISRLLILLLIIFLTGLGITFLIPGSVASVYPESLTNTGMQYSIVIDCGSSGSRIYVYHWPPHSGNPSDLLNIQQLQDTKGEPIQKKVSPGLSSFGDNPDAASDHIKDLLHFAQKNIPKEKWAETFLYVMATAGMRMLPESQQQAILLDLQTDVKKDFNFIALDNHFEIISGKQEGMYAWMAINYALNRFEHVTSFGESASHRKRKTVGMIDMGGGSVQIAYEVSEQASKEIPSTLRTEFNLGCQESDELHTYRLYVTTFLGFGANSALSRYQRMLVKSNPSLGSESAPIPDVCLPSGMKHSTDDKGATHHFIGRGEYDTCKSDVLPLTNKTAPCSKPPCSINGVYQPEIKPSMEFYGFSEFWYSMEDVYGIGGHYSYSTFDKNAKDFCSKSWDSLQKLYKDGKYPKADEHRFNYQCFKSAWMTQVFHGGLSFPLDYSHLTSAQLVNGKDVGWTLGALLYKTRFLPLRDVERRAEVHAGRSLSTWTRMTRLPDLQILLVICVLVVAAAIVVYVRWLRICPRPASLSRSSSMTYFMGESPENGGGKGAGFVL